MGKEKQANDLNTHYLSNNPVSMPAYYKEGVAAIETMVEKDKVNNIGVVAPYGAGKSSLIATYVDENSKKKQKKKTIKTVSLLNLYDKNDNVESLKNDKDRLVEKSILEQLFFKESKRKLPFSKIERIHNRFWTSFLFSFLLTALIVFILLTFLEFNKKLPNSGGDYFYVYLGISIGLFLVSVLFSVLSFRINRISFKNIEIEFNNIKSGSVLNLFLDEIVYFFRRTKTDVVVFEDIDRFGSVSIFTKLREINNVVNNNKRIGRKITFIYCVTDDFFNTDQDRAKFFEFVLSLVPVLNPKNVDKHINDSLEDNGMKLDAVFVKKVSRFINDKRILNDIINDFFYFHKELNIPEDKKEKLFAMMVYKNLYFDDYVKLQRGEGVLFNLFNNLKGTIAEKANFEINNKLVEVSDKILKIKESQTVIKNFSDLKNAVLGVIVSKGAGAIRMPQEYIDIQTLTTFKNIQKGVFVQIHGEVQINYYQQNVSLFKYMTVEQLTSHFGNDLAAIEDGISEGFKSNLVKEQNDLKRKQLSIGGLKLKDLISGGFCKEDIDKATKEKPFLLFALRNGWIDESYYMYLGTQDSRIDKLFVGCVVSEIETDPNQILENCELIIEEINESDFNNKYVFNYSLLDAILKMNDDSKKRNNFLEYLSQGSDDSLRFISGFFSNGYSKEPLLMSLYKHNPRVISGILDAEYLSDSEKMDLIYLLIKNRNNISFDILNEDGGLTRRLEEDDTFIERFSDAIESSSKELLIKLLEDLKLKNIKSIAFDEDKSAAYKEVFDTIVEENRYGINYENLATIEKVYLKANQINLSILLVLDKPIKSYIEQNIEKIVLLISNNNDLLHEDEAVVTSILSNEGVSVETKECFVGSLADDVAFVDTFKPAIYEILLKKNKLSKEWKQLSLLLKKKVVDDSNIVQYVVGNIDSFKGKLTDPDLFVTIFNSGRADNDLIKRLINVSEFTIDPDLIKDDSVCGELVEHGNIGATNESFNKCAKRFIPLLAILSKNEAMVTNFNSIKCDTSILINLLASSELKADLKVIIVSSQKTTINENLDNAMLRSALVNMFNESGAFVFETNQAIALVNDKGIDQSTKERVIEKGLTKYVGKELVDFISAVNPGIINDLLDDKKDETFCPTNMFDNDIYIDALKKKGLIHKCGRRTDKNTKINVSKLSSLFSNN